ncbi:hypothetical protein N5J75_11215 [Pantoea brenneri]|uniref:hypothetical protein n=1 Tax=Pantoea brenneri TaxID=472694 RepID=UPI00244CFBE5|nr:hypothetical protein [Pantoea brenneri]MDH2123767.1 hypothetical protein [Pantoea brenneri]
MNVEQKLAALEAELAQIKAQQVQVAPEELAKQMREVAIEAIKNAQRPGGVLHKR